VAASAPNIHPRRPDCGRRSGAGAAAAGGVIRGAAAGSGVTDTVALSGLASASSASARSSALAHRSSALFARQRWSTASNAGESAGTTALADGTGASTCWRITAYQSSPT
jgi:hypothetical protein